MYTFATLEVEGKKYSSADAKKIIPSKIYGLDDRFYGGRIKYIGTTNSDILLLMTDANTVIDLAAESLINIPTKLIRKLCERRKLPVHPRHSREKLLEILEGGGVSEGDDEG